MNEMQEILNQIKKYIVKYVHGKQGTVGKTEINKVYDPACGSGSLLLKFAKVLGKENVIQFFYG